jgi:O-antigen ligase
VPSRPARSGRPHREQALTATFRRPSAATVAFAILACVVALTGGSSRADIGWLLVLRPVAVLCIVALLLTTRLDWRSIRPLPVLLALFAATIGLQLVPLPPALWYGLGGRQSYDAVARALDGTALWHPLAIAPDRAWNSLVALLVPLGMMAGFAALNDRQRQALLWPMLGLVGFSMVLGLMQIAGGGTSPLYWYRVSGHGQLIGLLANRNHQGALFALALPLLRAWTLFPATNHQAARVRLASALAAAAAIILYVLVLGSRAGVALVLVGLIAAFLVEPSLGAGRLSARTRWLIAGGLVAGIAGLLMLVVSMDRAVAIGRLSSDDLSAEGRLAALPTLLHIVAQTLPWGTGFGSFVPVYASYEPDALLKPTYFNNAHNDLIELAITGGIPSLAVFFGFLGWWGWASWRSIATTAPRPWRALQRASALAILILLLASLTDYPLRTPLLGAVFTILCCWLARTPTTERLEDHRDNRAARPRS